MALLQNKRIIYQTPGFFFGGQTISVTNSFVKNYRGRFIGETFDKKASMPLGTEGRFAYVLAQKGGGLATYTDISGEGTVSGSQSNGINIEGTLEGTSSLTSNVNLITSMLASLIGSGTLSASMVGTVQLASELVGSGDVTGGLKMFAGMVASLNGSGSLEGTMKGWANMEADIYVNQSETTVKQLVDGVWNAIASEYNGIGTMGEAAQTGGGGGGGGATAAQIWSYSDRTLTESAGGGATVEEIWTAPITTYSPAVGSFAEKFANYGGVSHVIDRSSLDEDSKKELKGMKEKMELFTKALDKIKTVDVERFENAMASINNIKNVSPSIITTESKYEETIGELIAEGIPLILEKIDETATIIPLYEELLSLLEERDREWESLVESILNNNS